MSDAVATESALNGVLPILVKRCTISLGILETEWDELYARYLEEYYPGDNTKRTNLKRAITEKPDYTWNLFMEAITMLFPIRAVLKLTLHRESGSRDEFEFDLMNQPAYNQKSKAIKRDRKNPFSKIFGNLPDGYDVATFPTLVNRSILAKRLLTWKEMDIMHDDFMADKYNRYMYREKTDDALKKYLSKHTVDNKLSWASLMIGLSAMDYETAHFRLELDMSEKRKGDGDCVWKW